MVFNTITQFMMPLFFDLIAFWTLMTTVHDKEDYY
jgi:hypothetical protein